VFKKCCICKKELKRQCFYKSTKSKDGLQSKCVKCHKLYRKKHYLENKQKYLDKAKANRAKYRKDFLDWIKSQKCNICSNNDFRVLEFHHKRDKEYNISKKVGKVKFETLKKEINKCEILCANCHRIKTAEQFGYYN